MKMASEKTLRKMVEHATKKTRIDVLARMTLELQPADKFRLAAMLLDAGIQSLAVHIVKRACDEIELSDLLLWK